jgi:tetratricopeptide (TPR) repeat protein
MADMDKRHFEIREGAGLEESRLNYEFIDFLKKWSTPILLVVAVVALGYAGWQRYTKSKATQLGDAFKDLNAASGSYRLDRVNPRLVNPTSAGDANPDVLRRVADDYPKIKSVATIAKLQAADAYLRAVRVGAKPGATFNQSGALTNADDALKPEDVTNYLENADALYKEILTTAQATQGQLLMQINAHYGIAAVAESRGKMDEAKAAYNKLIELCDGGPFSAHAQVARKRIASLDGLSTLPTLAASGDYPRIEGFDRPVTPPPAQTPTPADPSAVPNPAPTDAAPGSAPANSPSTAPATTPPASDAPATPPATPDSK